VFTAEIFQIVVFWMLKLQYCTVILMF